MPAQASGTKNGVTTTKANITKPSKASHGTISRLYDVFIFNIICLFPTFIKQRQTLWPGVSSMVAITQFILQLNPFN
jgi:hypothetical protein